MRLIGTMTVVLAVALLFAGSPALANVEDLELRVSEHLITSPPAWTVSTFYAAPAVPSGAIRSLEDRGIR